MSGHYYARKDDKRRYYGLAAVLVVVIVLSFLFSGGGKDKDDSAAAGEKAVKGSKYAKNKTSSTQSSTTSTKARRAKKKASKEKRKPIKDLPTLVKRVKPAICFVKTYTSTDTPLATGTGFFIDKEGIMVSNRHVFGGAHRAEILNGSKKFEVKEVIDSSHNYDLVRIKVNKGNKKIVYLPINEELPTPGERVFVIGNPKGLEYSVSDGIVSAVRDVPPFGQVIQITSPISPGSSGSPVLNLKGEVIGVATFNRIGGQNLNFAIPIRRLNDLQAIHSPHLTTVNYDESDDFQQAELPFDKGVILVEEKKYQGAIPFFKKVIKKDPNDAQAHYYLGVCYRNCKISTAVTVLQRAIELDSNNTDAYIELGRAYVELNQFNEAISALEQAVSAEPTNDVALLHLGIAYYKKGNNEVAISMLKKSLDNYESPEAYMFLGSVYLTTGRAAKAILPFRQALDLDSEYLEAYIGLAASYANVKSWKQGIKMMNKLVIKVPDNPAVHYWLGMLHLGNDDVENAKYELRILSKMEGRLAYRLRNHLSSSISYYSYGRRYRIYGY